MNSLKSPRSLSNFNKVNIILNHLLLTVKIVSTKILKIIVIIITIMSMIFIVSLKFLFKLNKIFITTQTDYRSVCFFQHSTQNSQISITNDCTYFSKLKLAAYQGSNNDQFFSADSKCPQALRQAPLSLRISLWNSYNIYLHSYTHLYSHTHMFNKICLPSTVVFAFMIFV